MHTHKFKLEKGFLWCECGKSKKTEHECMWEFKERKEIDFTYKKSTEKLTQVVEIQQCEICGKLQSFNLTTGNYN